MKSRTQDDVMTDDINDWPLPNKFLDCATAL